MPLFSIIIPVFNGEGTILEAINSVKLQSYKDYELLIIDDASTDKTQIICERLDFSVRYKKIQKQGVSAARNHGAFLANGDYLLFLDSDDCLESEALEICSKHIKEEYPDVICFRSKLRDVITQDIKELDFTFMFLRDNQKIRYSYLAGSFAIKRNLFLKSKGYDSRLNFAENNELVTRIIFDYAKIPKCDNKVLVTHNINFNGFSKTSKYAQSVKAQSFEILLKKNSEYWKFNYLSYIYVLRRYIVSQIVLKKYSVALRLILNNILKKPRYFVKYFFLILLFPIYRQYLLRKGFRP